MNELMSISYHYRIFGAMPLIAWLLKNYNRQIKSSAGLDVTLTNSSLYVATVHTYFHVGLHANIYQRYTWRWSQIQYHIVH